MDAKDIIKEFLDNGFLLTPEEFDYINKDNYTDFLDKKKKSLILEKEEKNEERKKTQNTDEEKKIRIKENPGKVKSKESKQEFLFSVGEEKQTEEKSDDNKIEIKVLSCLDCKRRKSLKMMDIISSYNDKYGKVKNILSGRMKDLVSINKINEKTDSVNIIGMVSQKTDHGFMIEDGSRKHLNVICSDKRISNEDIIGITGKVRNGNLIPDSVVFPEIPLDNSPGNMSADISMDIENNCITINSYSHEIKSDAELLHVSKDEVHMKVLFYKADEGISGDDAISILRKRCIDIKKDDGPRFFVLDDIPDMFIVSVPKEIEEDINYKGIPVHIRGRRGDIVSGKNS